MSQGYIKVTQRTSRFIRLVRCVHILVLLYALAVLILSPQEISEDINPLFLKEFWMGAFLSFPLIITSGVSLVSLAFNRFCCLSLCFCFFTFLGALALAPALSPAAFPLLCLFVLLYGSSMLLFLSRIRSRWVEENPAFRELARNNAFYKPRR